MTMKQPRWRRAEDGVEPPYAVTSADRGHGLLSMYREQDVAFFASDRRTLLVQPQHVVEPQQLSIAADPTTQACKALQACERELGPGALLIGSFPFERDSAARMWLAHRPLSRVGRAVGPAGTSVAAPPFFDPAVAKVSYPGLTPQGYVRAVERALARVDAGELDKVVLARSVAVALGRPLDRVAFLRRLASHCPAALMMALRLPPQAGEQSTT